MTVEAKMKEAGYILRKQDVVPVRVLSSPPMKGKVRAVLLSGEPGVGKTFFAECFAQATSARLKYYLFHRWSGDAELVKGVDLEAFALATHYPEQAERITMYGALAQACMMSREGPVVFLGDELDKAPQETEDILLKVLQDGILTTQTELQFVSNPENLVFIFTTNQTRDPRDATLRRMFRYRMDYLPLEDEVVLLTRTTGVPRNVCKPLAQMAEKIRGARISSVSTQEMQLVLHELRVCRGVDDLVVLLQGRMLKQGDEMSQKDVATFAASIWGEYRRWKKGGGK